MLLLLPTCRVSANVTLPRVVLVLLRPLMLPVALARLRAIAQYQRSTFAMTRGVGAAVAIPTVSGLPFPVLGRPAAFTASWPWELNLVRAIVGWIKVTILLLPLLSLLLPLRAEARGLLLLLGASVPVPFLSTSP